MSRIASSGPICLVWILDHTILFPSGNAWPSLTRAVHVLSCSHLCWYEDPDTVVHVTPDQKMGSELIHSKSLLLLQSATLPLYLQLYSLTP